MDSNQLRRVRFTRQETEELLDKVLGGHDKEHLQNYLSNRKLTARYQPMHDKPYITLCVLWRDSERLCVGASVKSKKDKNNRSVGKDVALMRAVANHLRKLPMNAAVAPVKVAMIASGAHDKEHVINVAGRRLVLHEIAWVEKALKQAMKMVRAGGGLPEDVHVAADLDGNIGICVDAIVLDSRMPEKSGFIEEYLRGVTTGTKRFQG